MSKRYIEIEPLQPPFPDDVVTIQFVDGAKTLAVSSADYARMCRLLGTNNITDRNVVLTACADQYHIRVEPLLS